MPTSGGAMNRREAIVSFLGLPAATTITRVPVEILRPNDVIVFESPSGISSEMVERIKQHAQTLFPNHKIVVMGDGLHMRIVSGARE